MLQRATLPPCKIYFRDEAQIISAFCVINWHWIAAGLVARLPRIAVGFVRIKYESGSSYSAVAG